MKRVLGGALAVMITAALYGAAVPDGKRWWSYVQVLANDEMKGRNTGSPEHLKAAEYVAAEFARLNLKPAGEQGFCSDRERHVMHGSAGSQENRTYVASNH